MTKYIAPKNETYLSAEIAYTKGDKIDLLSFREIKSIVEKDILKVGVIQNRKILRVFLKIKKTLSIQFNL